MKKLNWIIVTICSLFIASASVSAQSLKIAYINTQELLQAMPETDSVQQKLQKLSQEYQTQTEQMQVELNKKYQEFQEKQATYSDLIKQSKYSELTEMSQRIDQFQQTAQQDLQTQKANLYKPVLDKANNAISEVAKENKVTYVLDNSAGVLLYHAEDSFDLLPLVKKKLGLK
jgi:outer membrane protein